MENFALNLKNGKLVNVEIVENKGVKKSMRGFWEAELIVRVVESNEYFTLKVTKSYSGKYYACSHIIYGYKSNDFCSSYTWNVYGDSEKEKSKYYFNEKIRATEKKVNEILLNSFENMKKHLVEIL